MEYKKKILIILIIIILIVFVIKKINNIQKVNIDNTNSVDTFNNSNQVTENKISILSDEQSNSAMNELKVSIENKTNKPILSVNGKEISEREIAYFDFQLNNSAVNENGEKKDAIKEIIKQEVVCQEAEKLNITLTDQDIAGIQKKLKNTEEVNRLAEKINLSYDEFIEIYTNGSKKLELKRKWFTYITEKVINGEISIDNKIFKDKYKRYNESTDIPERTQLLSEMIELYKEDLVSKANIEYIN